jgi:hypothetical protein
MKKFGFFLLPALLLLQGGLQAQMTFKKGMIMDSVAVSDSIPESFSLYLPTSFEAAYKWPVLIVFDMEGRGSQALGMFREAAEEKRYILVASNHTYDSLSISDNILITNRMLKSVLSLFPVHQQRIYTAGLATGAQMATLVPSFIKGVAGVLSLGSDVPNTEILNNKNPFYFLGIVGKGDFNYLDMSKTRELLNRKNFPNNLFVFDGEQEWPDGDYLKMCLDLLTLQAISGGHAAKDETLLRESYGGMIQRVDKFINARRFFRAYNMLEQVAAVYDGHLEVDSLDDKLKTLKREPLYRSQKREENSILLRESLIREDYRYYLEEDILTYNFNNLGWWTYQMEELKKHEKSGKLAELYMGMRLNGYLNALIEDNIDLFLREKVTDEEALLFLYMLKTISSPLEYPYYLKIISLSSKYEDYGTALFYLEELLKNGYKDKAQLYQLEHTALIRITPEYNTIIGKFLKDARYEIIEK